MAPGRIKEPSTSLKGCFFWGLGAFYYFYKYVLEISPSVMQVELMQAYNIEATGLGMLASFYGLAYAATQIPAGVLMDRYGPRRLLSFATLMCGIGCLVFQGAHTLFLAELGRLCMGIGGGFAVVGCMKIASLWFPSHRFALLAGLMVMLGMLGAASGQKPVATIMSYMDWRDMLLMFSGIGFVLTLVIFFFMRQKGHVETQATRSLFYGLGHVLKNKQIWLISTYAGLMFIPTLAFGGMWGVSYIQELYHLANAEEASSITMMVFFGWIAGGPTFGWISDTLKRRIAPMMVATVFTLLIMSAVVFMDMTLGHMKLALFGLGFFSSAFVIGFSVVKELTPPDLTGTAVGFLNTLNTLFSAIIIPVIGKILDNLSTGVLVNGLPHFDEHMFRTAFIAFPVCLFIALVILPLVKETHARPMQ